MSAIQLISRFVREDSAQDLVEYAYLAAFLGLTGYLALNAISGEALTTYTSWVNPATGMPSIWDPNDPLPTSGS
jgi:Flp pilus assembly pilin Flp